MRLDWNKRGHLTLSHRDADGHSVFLHVPVEVHGKPPVITFHPVYLAQALEIGSTLCLSDEMSPGIPRHPSVFDRNGGWQAGQKQGAFFCPEVKRGVPDWKLKRKSAMPVPC